MVGWVTKHPEQFLTPIQDGSTMLFKSVFMQFIVAMLRNPKMIRFTPWSKVLRATLLIFYNNCCCLFFFCFRNSIVVCLIFLAFSFLSFFKPIFRFFFLPAQWTNCATFWKNTMNVLRGFAARRRKKKDNKTLYFCVWCLCCVVQSCGVLDDEIYLFSLSSILKRKIEEELSVETHTDRHSFLVFPYSVCAFSPGLPQVESKM